MTTALAYSWWCIEPDCDAHGSGDRSNAEAEAHMRRTHPSHATRTHAEPRETR